MKKENPTPDFIAVEKAMLKFWKENDCFKKLVEKNKDGERFRFLDGPITANNPMGIHHAWGRTLKDVNMRYNAMLGKSCQYRNGFDAQGLWVEVEVEKELGLKDKRGILEYGMDKFTEKCMERVRTFSAIITEQSKRLGQWMDWENSYYTNTDLNITSIWYFLKTCHEKGLLIKRHRPMPWCPRCGTSLSEHEMTGSYEEVKHTSIYAKLPVIDSDDCIMVWTTTPWTLTSNVALAVNPDIDYVRVKTKSDSRNMIIAKKAIKALKDDIITVTDEFKGKDLVGLVYTTIFPEFECQNFVHNVVAWEDVDAEEGTGIVHIAPGCGAEDFDLGLRRNLRQICPIDDAGVFTEGFGPFAGLKTTEILPVVLAEMKKRNTLYKTEDIVHSYPHCWRCKTEVVFKLVDEWSIATDAIRPALIEASDAVRWEPEYGGKRMKDWLANMSDWNISRKRFYGLPLPFYPCKKCGRLTVVGSKEELIRLSENGNLDGVPHLHRPYIDKIKIRCPRCGALVERVPEVGDCWLDAGITPFSTKKYFEDKKYFEENFPSELIIEMKEQIRLWFYSMLFMSVVLTGKAPYERALTHASVVNENGSKFSKTGYMIRFDEAADKMGADPIRYLFCAAPVTGDVRFGYNLIDETRRKILSFWNIYVFFNIYASLDNPDIASYKPKYESLTHSDKWLLERTNNFLKTAEDSMKTYKISAVVKEFESFCDDVSNWYIRINRKRFWKSQDKESQMNAYKSLYSAIKTALGIMAPIIPFLTDYIWQNTVREIEKDAPVSVHLSDYPKAIAVPENKKILAETAMARNVITVAQRLRNEISVKIKQPLRALHIAASNEVRKLIEPLADIVADEINVKKILFDKNAKGFKKRVFSVNFRAAGAKYREKTGELKKSVESLDNVGMEKLGEQYDKDEIFFDGFGRLTRDMFTVREVPKEGFAVADESDFILALDVVLTEELKKEGFVRELIRQIQVLRKDAGFAVEQRIRADIRADEASSRTIEEYSEKIKQDVLATELAKLDAFDIEREIEIGGNKITVGLSRDANRG